MDLSAYHIAIVKPNIHVSTAEAYWGVTPKGLCILCGLIKFPVKQWQIQNDFEQSVFMKYPAIEDLKIHCINKGLFMQQ